jgi:hypothetical protein
MGHMLHSAPGARDAQIQTNKKKIANRSKKIESRKKPIFFMCLDVLL